MAERIDKAEARRVVAAFVASHALFYGAMATPFFVVAYAPDHLPVTLAGAAIALVGSFAWMRSSRERVGDNGSRAEPSKRSSPRHN